MHRNPKNTKHWRLSWYRYKTFITFFKFRFLTRGERDAIFLCWLFFHRQLSTHWLNQCMRTSQSTNCPGLTQVQKINSLRLSPNLNSLLLFKITKNPSPSLPGMTSFTSPSHISYLGFLLWHLWLSHPPGAREHLYSMCAPNLPMH